MIAQDQMRAVTPLSRRERPGDDAVPTTTGLSTFYLTSLAPRPPLSIGLLLDGVDCPRFVARIIEDIRACNFARIDLAVYHAGNAPPPARRASLPRRLFRVLRDPSARRLLLYDLYVRLDGRRIARDHDPLAPVDCRDMLADVDSLTVAPLVKGFTHRFAAADVDHIRARKLDVLLRFGFNILRGEILKSARYGVWSFHHDDNEHYRGGPAGFWELYEGNPVSGVMLQVLTEELDAGLVLCKSHFATARGASVGRNRQGLYWGSTHFVIRKLHELHRDGWDHVRERAVAPVPYRGRRATYKRPGNLDMTRFFGRGLGRAAVEAARAVTQRRERLAVRVGARPLHDEEGARMEGFAWLGCPRGHSYADPFLIARDGASWVFFRDYSHAAARGTIACAELRPSGVLGPVRPCLDLGRDLAYPMIFESEGEAFMIPAAPATGAVDLYRATAFPVEWKLEKRLHRIDAVTTTVCQAAGRWWFFVAVAEPPGHCAALYLFHAASLTGAWTYHPANPIATDVRTARGAGAIFTIRGRRIRPSRAGGPARGQGVTLNEILELTPEAYRDRPMVTVEAAWSNGVAGGSYAHGAGIEMIDGWPSLRRSRPRRGQGVREICVASPE